jgi:N-acyl-D-aspartate/D-glutamate deacylase
MYDLVIRAARIIDGTGAPAFDGDVGIVGEQIVALSAHLDGEAHQVIEAGGKVVAPGFIDAHTHDDLAVLRSAVVLPKVHQGATSLVIGNCGFGVAPIAPAHMTAMQRYAAPVLGEDDQSWDWPTMGSFLDTLRTLALGQHVRPLLGHTAVRVAVMGFAARPATEQEILAQEVLVAEAMQAGAAGLSLGLMYTPGIYTPTSELVRLARVVGRYGGVVAAHMRSEGDGLLNALDEMLALAEQAQVTVHISHLKVTGRKNWGSINKALERIVAARARGLAVTVDVYPYAAGSTTMTQLLPPWMLEGGIEQMLARLSDPAAQQRVRHDVANGLPDWENQVGALGWERIALSSVQHDTYRTFDGLNMVEAAERLGLSPEEACMHLLTASEGHITIILFSMDEQDVNLVIQASFAMIGSDGLPLRSGRPHPRLYGTFPRFIQRYVRELKLLTLEEAIWKITAFPAARFGLTRRGVLAAGMVADLVVFDAARIGDLATYREPQVYPEGILAVIVSGQPVILHGQLQPARPGRLLSQAG